MKLFKNTNKKFKFLIILIIILLIELILLISSNKNLIQAFSTIKNSSNTVILTEYGFEPRELIILKGSKVFFITKRDKEFWPASDFHPTHEIYSEFDSKRPVSQEQSWEFTFEKIGNWTYHDHLDSKFEGKIVVIENVAGHFKLFNKDINSNSDDTVINWSEELEKTIETEGLVGAFDLFNKLFTTDPRFAENCHGYTHELGENAYELYKNGEDFTVTPQVAYCSYGFFHGFIEAMMQEDGNLEKAEEMCGIIDRKLDNYTESLGACYHGIGHGVTDGTDESTYGDPEKMIAPGLALCDRVGVNEYDKKICATGVFNALAIMYLDPKYNLNLDEEDPFWICRRQERSSFRHACYDDFKSLIMSISGNDFVKAARFIEEIPEDEYANGAIDNLATYVVYFTLKDEDYERAIGMCHSIQSRLRSSCIAGLGAGYMTAGVPDREYVRALEICKSGLINQTERNSCFERVIPLIKLRYASEKANAICQTLEDEYRLAYCLN
jgi:hypothetical protein